MLLFALQACAGRHVAVGTMPIREQVEQSLAASGEQPVAPAVDSSIEVVVERNPGGLAFRNGDDIGGDLHWTSVELPPSSPSATPEELKEQLQGWLDGLREQYGTTQVIFLSDYAEALAAALQHHLERRFVQARVAITDPDPEARGRRPTIVASGIRIRDDGIKRIELELQTAEGLQIAEQGERRPRRHLAWMIPVSVISFPLGWLVVNHVQPYINRGAYLDAMGEAIDRTARAYADRLVEACGLQGAPAWCGGRSELVANEERTRSEL